MTDLRTKKMNELVNEVTKDQQNLELIKALAEELGISYSDEPMQLLNNVLKGIHSEGPKNESNF